LIWHELSVLTAARPIIPETKLELAGGEAEAHPVSTVHLRQPRFSIVDRAIGDLSFDHSNYEQC
jgi:hypothetical protein